MTVLISELTTLRLGGSAARYVRCESAGEIIDAVRSADADGDPVLLVGGGSNLVVADAGFEGMVLHVCSPKIEVSGTTVRADAGAVWDDVVALAVAAGLGGLECLSGIPGSAGATPVQNVGAYGVEVASLLSAVQLLDRASGAVRWVAPSDLGLAYRTSRLKGTAAEVVLAVEFSLSRGRSAPIRFGELAAALGGGDGAGAPPSVVRDTVLGLRARKGMVLDAADHDTWSVGSFFTNPVVRLADSEEVVRRATEFSGSAPPHFPAPEGIKLSAGWLIERAGFRRGFGLPGAGVSLSTKHTLALTNRGSGTTSQLLELAVEVRAGVLAAFGVELTPEPVLVGAEMPAVRDA